MSDTSARDPSRDKTRDNARDNAMSVAAISSERIEPDDNAWTRRLVLFLRIMAVVSIAKGLYHWAQVTGFIGGEEEAFENQSMAWQTATIYFAVIELVAAVGLWLATPWGAVVWLTTVVSMAVIELMFPGIYGGSLTVVGVEAVMLGGLSRARLDGRARTAAIASRLRRIFDTMRSRDGQTRRAARLDSVLPNCSAATNASACRIRDAIPYNFRKFCR